MSITKIARSALEFFGLRQAPQTLASLRQYYFGDQHKQKRIDTLLTNPATKNNKAIAQKLEELGTTVGFENDEILITEGEPDDDVYWLLWGKVEIWLKGKWIATRESPISVGEKAAANVGSKRSATVKANGPVVALKVSGSDFRILMNDHSGLRDGVADDINARHNQLLERFVTSNESIPDENPRGYTLATLIMGVGVGLLAAFYSSESLKLPLAVAIPMGLVLGALTFTLFSLRHPRYRWARMSSFWLSIGAIGFFSRQFNFGVTGKLGNTAFSIEKLVLSDSTLWAWTLIMGILLVIAFNSSNKV